MRASRVSAFDTSMQDAFKLLSQDTESTMNGSSLDLEGLQADLAAGSVVQHVHEESGREERQRETHTHAHRKRGGGRKRETRIERQRR